mmetsp:Transcript_19388/g.58371  ORF Transcript_19388/g.58371 Transcript_19388/m.58371 type:complete len:227 (-) Transcript_19388:204-884(-)
MHEKSSIATLMSALFRANFCSFSTPMKPPMGVPRIECVLLRWVRLGVKPPRRKALPRTRRMLDNTEPSSESLTTGRRLARSACTETIISTAFPKLAFRRPLTVSLPRDAASSSVASPRILASGMSARKFSQNVHETPQPRRGERRPSGTQTSRTHMGCTKIVYRPRRLLGPSSTTACELPSADLGGRSSSADSFTSCTPTTSPGTLGGAAALSREPLRDDGALLRN